MIHHQIRPLEVLLEEWPANSMVQLDDQCVTMSDSFTYLVSKEVEEAVEDIKLTKIMESEDQCLETSSHEILQTIDTCEDHQEIEKENVVEGIGDLKVYRTFDAFPFQGQRSNSHTLQEEVTLDEDSNKHSSLPHEEESYEEFKPPKRKNFQASLMVNK